jgi:hypothetical protein
MIFQPEVALRKSSGGESLRSRMKPLILASLLLVLAPAAAFVSAEADPTVNPDDYPKLDAKQVGHLRHFLKLARQLPGDWSEMGDDWYSVPERSLRYQLAHMVYATASAQYNLTPAYREMYREIIDSFIQKLLLPDSWAEWASVSRGGRFSFPETGETLPPRFDPLAEDNVMYAGHVIHTAALYEALYWEGKYLEDGSLSVHWQQGTWGPGPMTFSYDLHKLAARMAQQFEDYGYAGIPCEPNVIFPECPQHAVLGLLLYDHVSGSAYANDVMPRYFEEWRKRGYRSEETGSYMTFYRISDEEPLHFPGAWSDGWTGLFMHAWQPEYVEAAYPAQRERHLEKRLHPDQIPFSPWEKSGGLGWFAALAAEVGDRSTVDRVLHYADTHFNPVWDNGRFFYPRNDDRTIYPDGHVKLVDPIAGNALLPMARLNPEDGLYRLHQKPWVIETLASPHVSDVDLLKLSVSQAFFDEKKEALILSFEPGPFAGGATRVLVNGFDPASGVVVGCQQEESSAEDCNHEWRDDQLFLFVESENPSTWIIQS